jgi:hypothetical protein
MINLEEIKKHIDENRPFLEHNKEIFDILEGELLPRCQDALRKQVLSDRAFKVASLFIPPINIIKRLVDKLSVVYSDAPVRTAENPKDQFLIDYYSESVNSSMAEANRFFNSMKAVAVEPFLDKGYPLTRVISGHQCLAKGSDPINPLKMTEFIKSMGKVKNESGNDGLLYFVYSPTEFYAIDGDGKQVNGYAVEGSINPLGIIPQTYIKRSKNLLVPKADSDLLQMGIMLPTMIANLNYACHMQGHSIVFGIDIDGSNLEINPDSLWLLQTSPSGVKPEIGMLKPTVDITEIWQSIASQLQMWFESRGIRTGESTGSQNSLSGIAMMIKELDVSSDVKYQLQFFKEAEYDLWEKISIQHNYWVDQGLVTDLPKFSPEFMPTIEFQEKKAYEDKDKIIDQQIRMVSNLLTSRKRARKIVNADLSTEELDLLENEIIEENTYAQERSFGEGNNQQEIQQGTEDSDSDGDN